MRARARGLATVGGDYSETGPVTKTKGNNQRPVSVSV